MLFAYRILLYLYVPILIVRLSVKVLKNYAYYPRLAERFGFTKIQPKKDGFWVHAVSLGEVNAASPLIVYLLENWPQYAITITTMTPTGSQQVNKLWGNRVSHCYLPYDLPGSVGRFLKRIKPSIAIIMETEIWPNLITKCSQNGSKIIYSNVRMSARSYQGYLRVRRLIAPALMCVDHFLVQSEADTERIIKLGAAVDRVEVVGNIKFDVNLPPSITEIAQSERRRLGWHRPVWVAGSTHEGEESILLEALAKILITDPDTLLVLVPRHPERFSVVYRLCTRMGFNTVCRSDNIASVRPNTAVYLGDTMGDLPTLIAAGDICFTGGSLVPIGGHNILESLASGVPVIFGPHMFNFCETARLTLHHKAGIQVNNVDQLIETAQKLLHDPELRDQYSKAGKQLVDMHRGGLEKLKHTIELIVAGSQNIHSQS